MGFILADPLLIPCGGDIQDLMVAIFDAPTFASGQEEPAGLASFCKITTR
jgi:hypothetical protein